MKLTIILLLSTFALTTAKSISSENVIEDNSENFTTPKEGNVIKTEAVTPTPSIKTAGSHDDEVTSAEVEEIISKLEVLLAEVNDDALQKCIANNDSNALAKARGADENLNDCLLPVFQPIIDSISEIESFNLEVFKDINHQFCKNYQATQGKCLNEYYSNIQACVSDLDMKGIKIYDNMINAAVNYTCSYEVEDLIVAAQNEFGCSSATHYVGFAFCIVPPFQEVVLNNNTSLAIPRSLVGKGCRLFKNMAHCVEGELKTCENTKYSDIIVGLFNAIANAIPDCPPERTEWEEHMGKIWKELFQEEQAQTGLLKLVKQQLDQLTSTNALQWKYFEEDQKQRKKQDEVMNSILKLLKEKQMI